MRVTGGSHIPPTALQELIATLKKFQETRYGLTPDEKIVLIELVCDICR